MDWFLSSLTQVQIACLRLRQRKHKLCLRKIQKLTSKLCLCLILKNPLLRISSLTSFLKYNPFLLILYQSTEILNMLTELYLKWSNQQMSISGLKVLILLAPFLPSLKKECSLLSLNPHENLICSIKKL